MAGITTQPDDVQAAEYGRRAIQQALIPTAGVPEGIDLYKGRRRGIDRRRRYTVDRHQVAYHEEQAREWATLAAHHARKHLDLA